MVNTNQADFNGDGVGDACDPTFILIGCPSDVVLVAENDNGSPLFFALPQVVHPSGRTRFELSHQPGTIFPIGQTIVTITAIAENNGETRSCSFRVTVRPKPVPSTPPTTPPPSDSGDQGTTNPPVFNCFNFGLVELSATLAMLGFVAVRRRRRR